MLICFLCRLHFCFLGLIFISLRCDPLNDRLGYDAFFTKRLRNAAEGIVYKVTEN